MRLGGGNVGRIKAAIAATVGPLVPITEPAARLPDALAHEFQRLSAETSQHILSAANKCWAAAWTASEGSLHKENEKLCKQVQDLERDLAASTDLIAEVEEQRDDRDQALSALAKEKAELGQVQAGLQSALRNAESDLRAAQRVIDTFERNQRQDRDDIRGLQRRIEKLVGEIAALKAKSPESLTAKSRPVRRKPG